MGSSNRTAAESAMPDAWVFLVASYLDVAEAEADFEALRQSYVDLGEAPAFDAVTIGRKASGEVRFHRERDRSQGSAEDDDTAPPSLAAGLTAALFPSVTADVPAGRLGERETLGTVAGAVVAALGRSDLNELGRHLDSSLAGLIAFAAAEQQERIRVVLTNASATMARVALLDIDKIVRTTDNLSRAASKRRRKASEPPR